ncbi:MULTISPECIES: GAF and ANTAR domain-containing protein [unclassified Curtobacterium]|jgi:transcriptional regulator with GAF, ATPase, and Fis domain|uniref:GAF and ANTAR domain-containing protein n=1 Tax=unclassified Curtobacterium TaxID=257496 RepID=UPI0008DCA4F1|nr:MULTISPECIES: GAF and ANTAR domain-containing protein [unclassified Curtobacterium]MCC8908677.1 GAF and ANTAR domain-containing protein [Curtobacterium sp. GD1]MDR6171571.1 transcriptional regulator with GAF, ATPase, and Fis domain [Curtobacterium sp. SORGH_AS_0776]OII26602.1 transcriptional regulator [Curtobacterium sp. MCBA15_016]
MAPTREHRLVDTFVALTDILVDDYDVVELLQNLVDSVVDIFDASAAGILLVNQSQELEVLASTSDRSSFLGLLQLDAGEGPCVECFATGRPVSVRDHAEMERRWPTFAAASAESGYASVHAIPMRLRDTTLGSLNLFRETEGALNRDDALAAQALTDVATISILQQRSLEHANLAQQQLQRALDSRIVIEQAKGFLAQTHRIDMDQAFAKLRAHARSNQELLADVARAVVERRLVIP